MGWWKNTSAHDRAAIAHIQIKVDNGPESSGVRTQFLKRMVEFVDNTRKTVQLLYYPPYHSKYNPIERCWGMPPDTPWQELARVQAQRFFIEHSFREVKSECDMADYQVRRWDAWHNHMALVMLGTLFLVNQKKAGRRQWFLLSFNDLVTALEHLLPRLQFTDEELSDIICKRHCLRQKVKESHARRSQATLE